MSMINSTIKAIVLISLAVYFLQGVASRKCIISPKYTVYVANSLPRGSPPLRAHCASGNDDLGTRTIAVGQNINWNFCESVVDNTLFFCHLWWGKKNAVFDVFTSKTRSYCFTHVCYWEADPEGILFDGVYPPQALVKVYDWNNTKSIAWFSREKYTYIYIYIVLNIVVHYVWCQKKKTTSWNK